jgi:hypothetical protein
MMTPVHLDDESVLIELAFGLLPVERRDEILAHLRTCAECEARFQTVVAEREHFRAKLADASPHPTALPQIRPRRTLRAMWVAAAACAAVVAVVVISRQSGPDAAREYWIPVGEESMVLRSAEEWARPDQVHGVLDAYARRNATEAIQELERFEAAPGDETSSALRDLFLASALLNAGRPLECEAVLQRLTIDTLPPQWRRQARWVRYLALTALDRNAEAQPLLDLMAGEPGEIGALARDEMKRTR